MKMIKISSVLLLSMLIMCAFIPEASARNHHRSKSRSSFGLSFNAAPVRSYAVVPTPAPVAIMPYRTVAPAPVYSYPYYYPTPVPAYNTPAPVYAPAVYSPAPVYAPAPVVIERSNPNVYVRPGFSFSYLRY